MQTSDYSDEELRRLWEHGLHEDNVFNERLNFFLIFQSVLYGVAGALLSQQESKIVIVQLLAGFGTLLSGICAYVQGRQKFVVQDLAREFRIHFREYRASFQRRTRPWPWRVSSMWLLAYGVPASAAALWIIVLALSVIGVLS